MQTLKSKLNLLLKLSREHNLVYLDFNLIEQFINTDSVEQYSSYLNNFSTNFDVPIQVFSSYLRLTKSIIFKQLSKRLTSKWSYKISRIISYTADFLVKLVLQYLAIKDELIVIAMGKWGGMDLNFLSDIDLIVLRKDNIEQERALELFYKFNMLISEQTPYGICFYTDYDLRPGGSSSPLLYSVSELLIQYTKYMDTWERLSWLRARGINITQEHEVFKLMRKLVLRKFLDFRTIDSIRDTWNKIITDRKSNSELIDLKLGAGGIRELEFIAFTRFLLNAGRLGITEFALSVERVLEILVEYKLITLEFSNEFREAYYLLRSLEDTVQSTESKRIHTINKEQLALINDTSFIVSWDDLVSTMKTNAELFIKELGPTKLVEETSIEKANALLSILNFLKLSRQEKQEIESLTNFFLAELTDTTKFNKLEQLYRAISGKKSIYTLLAKNLDFAKYLLELLVEGEYFSQIIYKHTRVLDLLFLRDSVFKNGLEFTGVEVDDIASLDDLHQKLIAYKLYKEFTLLVRYKNGLIDIKTLLNNLSLLAEGILVSLADLFIPDLSVVAMGRLGAREFSIGSDLDLVFLTDAISTDKLYRLRKFINFISSPYHSDLKLYDIDLDLRPHGKGVILTTIKDFKNFYLNDKQVWKFIALLKARPLYNCNNNLLEELKQKLKNAFTNIKASEFFKTLELVYREHTKGFNIKYSRGGLLSIEYLSRYWSLKSDKTTNSVLEELSILGKSDKLYNTYIRYLQVDLSMRVKLGKYYTGIVKSTNKDILVEQLIEKEVKR